MLATSPTGITSIGSEIQPWQNSPLRHQHKELNTIIRTAYAGESAGVIFENERRFDLVVRLDQEKVADLNLDKLFVRTSEGIQIPV